MISLNQLATPLFGASCMIMLVAALHDLAVRTVPNVLSLGVAILGLVRGLTEGIIIESVVVASGIFVVAALCWRFGWLGGGDAKLIAAASLGVPAASVPSFIAAVAFSGGALALVYLTARTLMPRRKLRRPSGILARIGRTERWRLSRGGPLPYACAIAAGFLSAAQ